MGELFVRFAPLFAVLGLVKMVGLLAVLVIAVSRHNASRGASGDLPFAIGAGALLVLPWLIRVLPFQMFTTVFLLQLVGALAFIAIYAIRTMSAGPAMPASDPLQRAFGRQGGAPIAIPPASPYMAPPQGFGAPPQGFGAPPPQGFGTPPPQGFGAPPAYGPPPSFPQNPYSFAQAPQPMSSGPLPSRSQDEMMLFMDLTPCACGETNFERRSSLVMEGANMVAVYNKPCARCGRPREFKFIVNDPIPARPGNPVVTQYGGAEPSKILDPGQFAYVSDMLAKRAPASLQGLSPEQQRAAIQNLDQAAALLEEALKFIPPGADEVPAHLFRTPMGVQERDRLPRQFRRDRLEARLGVYRQSLAQWRSGAA